MSNKLELTWYGKEEPIRVEPRLLIENAALSNCAASPDTENLLIHGDNLLALKALEGEYAGRVKCVYIDPPYNTGSAFEHYDDSLEHSQWLNLMRPRLEILRRLLSEDGSIWISIDDDEQAYLKVLCDEIFGRTNFVANVIWQKKASPQANSAWLSDSHDFILVYAKHKDLWKPNLLPRSSNSDSRYKNPDNDPRGVWTSGDCTVSLMSGQRGAQYARTGQSDGIYEIVTPSGRKILPPEGRCWILSKKTFDSLVADNRIWFGPEGDNVPRRKRFLSEVQDGIVAQTLWLRDDVGDNQEAKREVKTFNREDIFATPKPERLITRIIHIATNPGDLVLDSFLGSGTTAAVAHKMGRRWIGIEMGDHAYTYCKVRIDKVIAGEDKGGVTKAQNWHGGGGYRFYELAPSLINRDPFGEEIINPDYNADMLAAAVALHEGFVYRPDSRLFWKQSVMHETSFLFVTTRYVSRAWLDSIYNTMQDGETLFIAAASYEKGLERAYSNVFVQKIPEMLLKRCEYGRTDYNLNIVRPPLYDGEEEA